MFKRQHQNEDYPKVFYLDGERFEPVTYKKPLNEKLYSD